MLLIIMRLKRVLRERWISNVGGVLTYIACSLPLLLGAMAQSIALAFGGKKWGKTACIIGLCFLPGLLLVSLGDKKSELNEGLTAARAGDYAGAHAVWLPLARHGSAEAQYNLGWLYETGLGTEKNPFQAAKWYRHAAAQGHASAQYNLGLMSAQGRGMPRDDTNAASYFLEAANKGHAKAQYSMGILYMTGRGVPKYLRKADYWLSRAKANGIVSSNKATRV